jgi:hypothetical protein
MEGTARIWFTPQQRAERRGPAAITKSDNKKRFDPALCDSPKLIELSP